MGTGSGKWIVLVSLVVLFVVAGAIGGLRSKDTATRVKFMKKSMNLGRIDLRVLNLKTITGEPWGFDDDDQSRWLLMDVDVTILGKESAYVNFADVISAKIGGRELADPTNVWERGDKAVPVGRLQPGIPMKMTLGWNLSERSSYVEVRKKDAKRKGSDSAIKPEVPSVMEVLVYSERWTRQDPLFGFEIWRRGRHKVTLRLPVTRITRPEAK